MPRVCSVFFRKDEDNQGWAQEATDLEKFEIRYSLRFVRYSIQLLQMIEVVAGHRLYDSSEGHGATFRMRDCLSVLL